MGRRIVFIAMVAAVLTAASAVSAASRSASSPAQAKTKITVAVSAHYAALVAANKQGVFDAAGLSVRFIPMRLGKEVVKSVAGGRATFGIADAGASMLTATFPEPLDVKIVSGVTAYKLRQSAVIAATGVANAAALNQAKIAVPERGGVYHLAAGVWLDSNDADSGSVAFAPVAPARMGQALKAKTVAAAVSPAPFPEGKSLGDAVRSAFGLGAPMSVALASGQTVSGKAAVVRSFVRALGKVSGSTTKINLDGLTAEAETMTDYALTDAQPDLDTLVWSGAPKG